MILNKHSNLEGQHAFLGASTYGWLNYDEEKLTTVYLNNLAKQRGTELHEFAATCIRLGQKLRGSSQTLNMYVNDAIGFGMSPEVILYYSDNIFGTADALLFKGDTLRIHDLKTGITEAHFQQLQIYDALFCLEYKIKPGEIKHIHRIYQYDQKFEQESTADDIIPIMNKIVQFDKIIENLKEREA